MSVGPAASTLEVSAAYHRAACDSRALSTRWRGAKAWRRVCHARLASLSRRYGIVYVREEEEYMML